MKLMAQETLLLVIDVQEKIFSAMHEQEKTKQNISRLIKGSKVLNIPVVWAEQYPTGLGPTLKEVATALNGAELLEKITFSCLGDDVVSKKIKSYNKNQTLVCGIETHVCIYQTVQDLLINNDKGRAYLTATLNIETNMIDGKINFYDGDEIYIEATLKGSMQNPQILVGGKVFAEENPGQMSPNDLNPT